MEEIRTDNTETLRNALERIAELEKENADLKAQVEKLQKEKEGIIHQEVVDVYSRFPC